MSYYPGYYGPREYYRGRRRRRSPFDDMNLASLGKLYTDVPVTAVQTAMEGLNKEYLRVADQKDALSEALAAAQVMEGDNPEKQNLIKGLQDQINTFVEDTGGAFEKGDKFVRGLAKDVSQNPWLYQAIENKKLFDEDQKMLDEMRVKGLAPLYLADENFTTMGADGAPQGYQSYIGSRVDRRPVLESFFNQIKADRRDLVDEFMNITTTQTTEPRVKEVIGEAFDILKGTKEYQQSLENAKAEANFNGQPFDQAAFDNQWKNDLRQVGAEFSYTQISENPNRTLFNAAFQRPGDTGPTGFSQNTLQPQGSSYMRGTDTDAMFNNPLGLGGDDSYRFFTEQRVKNPTMQNLDSNGQRIITVGRTFSGPVIDMTDERDNQGGSEGQFRLSPSGGAYNATPTGEFVTVPIVVGDNNAFYKGLEEEIRNALIAQDDTYNWTMSTQKGFAGEMPYAGAISGMGGGRYGDIEADIKPLPLTVQKTFVNEAGEEKTASIPMSYIVKNGQPLIVESEPFAIFDTFDSADPAEANNKGRVLQLLDPTVAANQNLKTSYRTLYQDGGGDAANLGNMDFTIGFLQDFEKGLSPNNPLYQLTIESLNAAVEVRNKFNEEGGRLDAIDYAVMREIDQKLMGIVLKALNPDPTIVRELSKTRNNSGRL